MTDAQIKAAAEAARHDQLEALRSANSPLAAYWAGSAAASVAFHARRGATRTVKAR